MPSQFIIFNIQSLTSSYISVKKQADVYSIQQPVNSTKKLKFLFSYSFLIDLHVAISNCINSSSVTTVPSSFAVIIGVIKLPIGVQ